MFLEPFSWRDLEHIVNNFKIRGSWGELGNCNTTALSFLYQTMPQVLKTAVDQWKETEYSFCTGIVSAEMTWETVRSWNIILTSVYSTIVLTGHLDHLPVIFS